MRIHWQTTGLIIGFTIHKRHTTAALNSPTSFSVALFIFQPQKTDQSSFCTTIQTSVSLKCAKVSPCKKTDPYLPCSHFTTNSTGGLPRKSNHRHWERFHTTLDILRHGQTQTQPQSQHPHTLHTAVHTQQRHNLYSHIRGKHPPHTLRGVFLRSALANEFNLLSVSSCFSNNLIQSVISATLMCHSWALYGRHVK